MQGVQGGSGYSPGVDDGLTDPDGPIDLHNKEFCVDVSTYQPVIWEERDAEACKTEWRMECEDRTEQVCADVSETRCDVSSYLQIFVATVWTYDTWINVHYIDEVGLKVWG